MSYKIMLLHADATTTSNRSGSEADFRCKFNSAAGDAAFLKTNAAFSSEEKTANSTLH